MTSAAVGREDLERQLEVVRALAPGEMEGVFGPDSLTWRIDREALTFLGAGRALLLQLAHPWVAAAIAEHSKTIDDPIGRFHRTFAVVFTMVFGTLDQALSAARALHRRHAAIHGRLPITVGPFRAGSPYQANDLAALRWIYATLVETALMTHDFVLPPLTGEERARYYAESHRFAALFGIPRAALPADWREFATYAEMMQKSDILTVSPAAREIARQIFSGAGMLLTPAAMVSCRHCVDAAAAAAGGIWLERYRQQPIRARACLASAHLSDTACQAAPCRSVPRSGGAAVGASVAGPRYAGAQPALDRTPQAGCMSSSPRPNSMPLRRCKNQPEILPRRLHPGGTRVPPRSGSLVKLTERLEVEARWPRLSPRGNCDARRQDACGPPFPLDCDVYRRDLQCPLHVCAVTRRRFPVGASPTRRTAPAGSNRSSHGGNEMAEAFGVAGHI